MKILQAVDTIREFSPALRGVFTLADLKAVFRARHLQTLYQQLRSLEAAGLLTRFARGIYVTEGFDPAVLSQTLCPASCISFESVLARRLVIGSGPGTRIRAVKPGKRRLYSTPGVAVSVEHLGIREALCTGFVVEDGVRYATPEKALLDTLYFHSRGYAFNFDIYSDPDLQRLDMEKFLGYLQLYENPKFTTFVKGVIHGLS
jgi:hypothetical protein